MDEAAVGADAFGEPGEEGDDVMPGLALDGVDAFQVFGRDIGDLGGAAFADGAGGGFRDGALGGHGLGGERLDVEPDAEAVLGGPDAAHFGAGVARNHRSSCGLSDYHAVTPG